MRFVDEVTAAQTYARQSAHKPDEEKVHGVLHDSGQRSEAGKRMKIDLEPKVTAATRRKDDLEISNEGDNASSQLAVG